MFDIGWSEMAVIALIALIVIGPKELPNAMRSVAKWTRKARSLAREFQSGIDDMVREADLEEARKAFDTAKSFDVDKAVEDSIDPTGSMREEAEELQRTVEKNDTAESEAADVDEAAESEAGDADEAAEVSGEGQPAGATVVEHPVNIAPPHSLTPPPEDETKAADDVPAVDSDNSQRRA